MLNLGINLSKQEIKNIVEKFQQFNDVFLGCMLAQKEI